MEPLFLQAFRPEPIARPPVWIMRQAGRYLKEYRELKEQHSFLALCRTPELAAEITLQPIRLLEPDAAIIFSDILLIGQTMGFDIDFNPGPRVANPVRSLSDVQQLGRGSADGLSFVYDALRLVKNELARGWSGSAAKALIGFAGAPWTLACYFIDQGPLKNYAGTSVWAYQQPRLLELLLEKLTAATIDYVIAQAESGADAIQIFDSWAGNLSAEEYQRISLPYLQRIFEALEKKHSRSILYLGGGSHLLPLAKQSGANAIGLDWRMPLDQAEEALGPGIVIQGNLNPAALCGPSEQVAPAVKRMLQQLTRRSRYIANLGHGILQVTPPENAKLFIETIKGGWSGHD